MISLKRFLRKPSDTGNKMLLLNQPLHQEKLWLQRPLNFYVSIKTKRNEKEQIRNSR